MKRLSIAFLILLIGLAGCTVKKPVSNQDDNNIEKNQEQDENNEKITDKYKKIKPVKMKTDIQNESLEEMYDWHVEKPYFEDFDNEASGKLVNDILNQVVSEYQKEMNFVKNPIEGEIRNTSYIFTVVPNVLYNKNGILCVDLNVSEYTGGAHGTYWSNFYSFDILNSKEIELKDIFKDDVDYMGLVYNYLFEQVKDNEIFLEDLKDYYEKKEKLNFFIEDNKVKIYFAVYVLGSYTDGEQTFEIPYEIVKNKLSPLGEVIYLEN